MLPPSSYTAALRATSSIGEPELLLDANEMRLPPHGRDEGEQGCERRSLRPPPSRSTGDRLGPLFRSRVAGAGGGRAAPIDRVEPRDRQATSAPLLRRVGSDEVADTREEAVAQAAVVPASLKGLLLEIGFRFDDPAVGRLETGDVKAIEELLQEDQAREIRGDRDRLFDSSGKASLTLTLDEVLARGEPPDRESTSSRRRRCSAGCGGSATRTSSTRGRGEPGATTSAWTPRRGAGHRTPIASAICARPRASPRSSSAEWSRFPPSQRPSTRFERRAAASARPTSTSSGAPPHGATVRRASSSTSSTGPFVRRTLSKSR